MISGKSEALLDTIGAEKEKQKSTEEVKFQ